MNYSQIRKMDISNGLGVRISMFVSGCPFHCKNCFNQETWDFNNGKKITEDKIKELKEYLNKSYIAGLSLLGGDPTSQNVEGLKTLIELCKYTHSINKNVWIWSGYTWEEIFSQDNTDEQGQYRMELIRNCDILVDGRYVDAERDLTLKWRGSKNQRVIDVQKSLNEKRVVLIENE